MQQKLEANSRVNMNAGIADSFDLPSGSQMIFVISDSTGETAKLLASRLLVQFEEVVPYVRIFAYVNTVERLAEVLQRAKDFPNTLIFATLVDTTMVGWLEKIAAQNKQDFKVIDVMTPLLNQLSSFLESESAGVPGMGVSQMRIDGLVKKEFFGMVEATQFVHETSFGLNRCDWPQADVALVGIDKVGKTGIAVSLAQRGIKAVGVGIHPDKPIPAEVKQIKKVVVVKMMKDELSFRRENHIMELLRKNISLVADMKMTEPGQIEKEEAFLDSAMRQNPAWLGPVDATYKDEAEVASEILRLIRQADQPGGGGGGSSEEGSGGGLPVLLLLPVLAGAAAYLAMHATAHRAASRTLGAGALPPPALAGGALPPSWRRGASCRARPAVSPVVRHIGADQRIEMEKEMAQKVRAEVDSEDPNLAAGLEKTIYVVSDSTGLTAQQLLSRLLVQFRNRKPSIRMRANVRTAEQVETIVDEVRRAGENVMVFVTIVDPDLLAMFTDMSKLMDVKYIDVMSPLLGSISDFFEKEAAFVPGGAVPSKVIVDQDFLNRVEAVQYVQQHLLGLNQKDWKNADVLLLGLSRVGKVSLAFFLAQYGIKAACTDIRPDNKLPKELFQLDPRKVVVIDMDSKLVARRRLNRVEEMRSKQLSLLFEPEYTEPERITEERNFLKTLHAENRGWLGPVDLTHVALEEGASMIIRQLRDAE